MLIERWRQFYNERRPTARIAINLRLRSVKPGWIPIISTRASLPDWSQHSAAGHLRKIRCGSCVSSEIFFSRLHTSKIKINFGLDIVKKNGHVRSATRKDETIRILLDILSISERCY